jgi:hypothetical protein
VSSTRSRIYQLVCNPGKPMIRWDADGHSPTHLWSVYRRSRARFERQGLIFQSEVRFPTVINSSTIDSSACTNILHRDLSILDLTKDIDISQVTESHSARHVSFRITVRNIYAFDETTALDTDNSILVWTSHQS